MRNSVSVLVIVMVLLGVATLSYETERPGPPKTISPEEAGYSAEKLEPIVAYLESIGSSAFLALHDGQVFFSWGSVDTKYPIHSIRKALVSALYGIAVAEGKIDLDATLGELGIDDIEPALTDQEKRAMVRDVISSRSGVYHPAAAEAQSMIDSRPARGSHPPGEFFYYNNWDFNVAGAILEKATGESLYVTFERLIAAPIGMTHFLADDGFYLYDEKKSDYPAYHFRMTAMDLARFGVLYQNYGRWDGRQLVPEEWIADSTKTRSVADMEMGLGYGYMWYTFLQADPTGHAFFHSGAGAHILAVMPDIKLVWVHRVNSEPGHSYKVTPQELAVLWEALLLARIGEATEE